MSFTISIAVRPCLLFFQGTYDCRKCIPETLNWWVSLNETCVHKLINLVLLQSGRLSECFLRRLARFAQTLKLLITCAIVFWGHLAGTFAHFKHDRFVAWLTQWKYSASSAVLFMNDAASAASLAIADALSYPCPTHVATVRLGFPISNRISWARLEPDSLSSLSHSLPREPTLCSSAKTSIIENGSSRTA